MHDSLTFCTALSIELQLTTASVTTVRTGWFSTLSGFPAQILGWPAAWLPLIPTVGMDRHAVVRMVLFRSFIPSRFLGSCHSHGGNESPCARLFDLEHGFMD